MSPLAWLRIAGALLGLGGIVSAGWLAFHAGSRAERLRQAEMAIAQRDQIIAGQTAALRTLAEVGRAATALEEKYGGIHATLARLAESDTARLRAARSVPGCRAFLEQRFPDACRLPVSASGAGGGDRGARVDRGTGDLSAPTRVGP